MHRSRSENVKSGKIHHIVESGVVGDFIHSFGLNVSKDEAEHTVVCGSERMVICFVNNAFAVVMTQTVYRNNMYTSFGKKVISTAHYIGSLLQVIGLNFMRYIYNPGLRIQRQDPAFYSSHTVICIAIIRC